MSRAYKRRGGSDRCPPDRHGMNPRVERLATRARGQGCERAAEHTPTTRHWHSGIRPCHQGASLGRSQRAACRSAHHPSLVHPIDPRRQRRPPLAAAPLADGHLHASSRGAPRGGRVHPRVQTLAQPAITQRPKRTSRAVHLASCQPGGLAPRIDCQPSLPVREPQHGAAQASQAARPFEPISHPRVEGAASPVMPPRGERTDAMVDHLGGLSPSTNAFERARG